MNYRNNFILLFINFILIYLIYCNINYLEFRNTNWLKDSNIFEKEYEEIKNEFSEKEQIIVLVKLKEKFFDVEGIKKLKIIEDQISNIKFISKIESPLSARSIFEKNDIIYNKSFYQALQENIINIEEYKKYLSERPYQKLLISDDYNINFFLKIRKIDQNLLDKIDNILRNQKIIDEYKFLGDSYLHFIINNNSNESLTIILIIAFSIISLYLFLSLRNIFYLNLIILSGLFSIFLTINLYLIFNFQIYAISIILPILMIVISVSDVIFIIAKSFDLQRPKNTIASYKEIIRKSYKPCLITSITTLVSFFSFITSDIIPLYQMSIIAIFSILISYILIIFIIPLILSYNINYNFKKEKYLQSHLWLRKLMYRIFLIIFKKKKIFLSTLFLGIVFLIIFAKEIRYETNFLQTFFRDDSKIMKDFNIFDRKYLGSGNINLVIKNNKINEYENFNKFLQLKKKLENINRVTQIRYYPDIVKIFIDRIDDKNKYNLPKNSEELQQSLLFIEFSRSDKEKDIISDYLNFSHDMALIKIFTPNLSSSEINKLKLRISNIVKNYFDNFYLSGSNIYYSTIAENLVKTQYISIFSILLTISISIFLFYNLSIMFLILIAAITPIIFIRLFTSYFVINFDISSIVITSISIGIAIDNAIHILNEIELGRKEYNIARNKMNVISDAFRRILLPVIMILVIFLIISACFYISELFIFQKLSILLSLTLTISFIINILLLPILYQLLSTNLKLK